MSAKENMKEKESKEGRNGLIQGHKPSRNRSLTFVGFHRLMDEPTQELKTSLDTRVFQGRPGRWDVPSQVGPIIDAILQDRQTHQMDVAEILLHKAPIGDAHTDAGRERKVLSSEFDHSAAVGVVLNGVFSTPTAKQAT